MSFLRPLAAFGARNPGADPEIQRIGEAITQRLRALDLHVVSRAHGRSFQEIFASSSPHMIVEPDNPAASGIAILLAGAYSPPLVVFERINSIVPGLGRRMVAATLDGLRETPGGFTRLRVNDLSPFQSDGRRWWEHVAAENADFDWIITHDEDVTHGGAGVA